MSSWQERLDDFGSLGVVLAALVSFGVGCLNCGSDAGLRAGPFGWAAAYNERSREEMMRRARGSDQAADHRARVTAVATVIRPDEAIVTGEVSFDCDSRGISVCTEEIGYIARPISFEVVEVLEPEASTVLALVGWSSESQHPGCQGEARYPLVGERFDLVCACDFMSRRAADMHVDGSMHSEHAWRCLPACEFWQPIPG